MAKRAGVKVNLVPAVYRWFRDQELRTGRSKSLVVATAICALRTLSKREREDLAQWAKLIEEEKVTWAEFEAACEQTEKQRAQALGRTVERVLRSEAEEHRKAQGA